MGKDPWVIFGGFALEEGTEDGVLFVERPFFRKEGTFAASVADHVEGDCVDDLASRRFFHKIPDQLIFFCLGNGSGVVSRDGKDVDLVLPARAKGFFRVLAKRIDAFLHGFVGCSAPAVFDLHVDRDGPIENPESPVHRRGSIFRAIINYGTGTFGCCWIKV